MTRALVIKYGDPRIAGAIADGMGATEHRPAPSALVRVAVGNTNTADDYTRMIQAAEHDYGKLARRRWVVGRALLVAWAALWLALRGYHETLSEWNREGQND